MRQIHKWASIAVGVVFLLWVVTGMVMVLPGRFRPTTVAPSNPTVVYARAGLSPAAVMATLARADPELRLQALQLRVVLDTAVYEVTPGQGEGFLLDATTGSRFAIDSSRAARLARLVVPEAPFRAATRLSRYARDYREGPLPVWEVQFDDAGSTRAWVSDLGHVVRIADDSRRTRELFGGLHVFRPIKRMGGDESDRRTAILLTGLACLVTIASGYYLALPRRRTRH
jgi:hypothetical protein